MSRPDKPTMSEHPEERLLLYLENQLSPDLRNRVEEHVRDCPQCAAELEKLDFTIASLKACREVFCPEPWELYEFVNTGGDSGGEISRHLEHCPLCREEIALFEAAGNLVETPEPVRKAFEENRPEEPEPAEHRAPRRRLSAILDAIPAVLHHPAVALACAAAVILIVVLVYPRGDPGPVMVLSPVTWKQLGAGPPSEKPRIDLQLMGPSPAVPRPAKVKPRVATVIFFKGFSQTVPQESIDDLYRALSPTPTIAGRYTMISPSQVRTAMLAIPEKRKRPGIELHKAMGTRLGAEEAILLTVTAAENRFKIETELVRTSDGEILGRTVRTNVEAGDLAAKVREAALGLLTETERPARRSP